MHWLCFSQREHKLVCSKSGITTFPEISQAKTLPDDILMKNSLRRRWSYNLALGLWNNWHEIQQSDLAAVSNSLPCLELRPSPQTGWHITSNTETQLSFCKTVKALLDFSPAHLYVYFCSSKLFFFQYWKLKESQVNKETKTLRRKHFLLLYFPLSSTCSVAREPYGDWQACYISLSCQLARALGSSSLKWRDKSLLTCQATVNANWACYQCIIYRESCRHFHRTGS